MYVQKTNASNELTTLPARKAITVPGLLQMKKGNAPIVMLTAYDASFADRLEKACVDIALVGDSLGMVIGGHSSTLPVTLDEIVYHTKAVSKGLKNTLLLADMPFSCMASVQTVIDASVRLMSEGGAAMIKIEGSSSHCLQIIKSLKERGIPVCAHLGLTPQTFHSLGGYRVQGKESDKAALIEHAAAEVEAAGANLLVLECVPETLGKKITESLTIPTIGIGAGVHCDGQVYDLLGITPGKPAKFAKNFLTPEHNSVDAAISAYVKDVRERTFPAPEHTYH